MFNEKRKKIVKIGGFIISILIICLLIFLVTIVYNQKTKIRQVKEYKAQTLKQLPRVVQEYGDIQNQTAFNLVCGVTDFESPFVRAVKCDKDKMPSGENYTVFVDGNFVDEEAKQKIQGVKVSINNGESVVTDKDGYFKMEVKVDTVKNIIKVVADKFGYSPIRFVENVKRIDDDGNIKSATRIYFPVAMRKSEVNVATLYSNRDTKFESAKYPGVSLLIPAGGLIKKDGSIVLGDINISTLYLTPEKSDDIKLIPGFNGNIKQMVGVDTNGKQVFLQSEGMVFFQITERGGNELLQLPQNSFATLTQPMTDAQYNILSDEKLQAKGKLSKKDLEYFRQLGVFDKSVNLKEKRDKLLRANAIAVNYWYFNKSTGLWEAWPVDDYQEDVKNKVYRLKIPRFY